MESASERIVMIIRGILIIAVAVLLTGNQWGCASKPDVKVCTQPTINRLQWGDPSQPISLPGLPKLYRVSDQLYRGAQPNEQGFRELANMGIKTVVNLRTSRSDRDDIGLTVLGYERIYVRAWHIEDEDVVKFIRIVTDPGKTPVFVHCRRGADRTGLMVAIYRIVVQGWPKAQAIQEMRQEIYDFDEWWQNIIEYLNSLDVAKLRKEAGLS